MKPLHREQDRRQDRAPDWLKSWGGTLVVITTLSCGGSVPESSSCIWGEQSVALLSSESDRANSLRFPLAVDGALKLPESANGTFRFEISGEGAALEERADGTWLVGKERSLNELRVFEGDALLACGPILVREIETVRLTSIPRIDQHVFWAGRELSLGMLPLSNAGDHRGRAALHA